MHKIIISRKNLDKNNIADWMQNNFKKSWKIQELKCAEGWFDEIITESPEDCLVLMFEWLFESEKSQWESCLFWCKHLFEQNSDDLTKQQLSALEYLHKSRNYEPSTEVIKLIVNRIVCSYNLFTREELLEASSITDIN